MSLYEDASRGVMGRILSTLSKGRFLAAFYVVSPAESEAGPDGFLAVLGR